MKSLFALARLHSIQLAFTDTLKRRRIASTETLQGLLAARGVHVNGEAECREAIDQHKAAISSRLMPPSIIRWTDRDSHELVVTSPGEDVSHVSLTNEGGERIEPLSTSAASLNYGELPIGYYAFEVTKGSRTERAWVAIAPRRAFERKEKRTGAFAPAYAIRSDRSTSIADVRDLGDLAERLSSAGMSILGTLPMLASYLDRVAFEPSPYAAVSRLFWNELYLDLEALPDLPVERREQLRTFLLSDEAAAMNESRMVDYATEAAWRGEFVSDAAEEFFHVAESDRRAAFDAFLVRNPLARRYAEFRAATQHFGRTWPFWDEPARSGDLSGVELPRETVHFHLYAQFAMEEQMAKLASRCDAAGCGLFLDFPLGSNSHGFDVWNERETFIRGAAIGAPPDLSYPQGQNWGFRPADPDRLRESGYKHWIDCIRHQLRCASMLRLDHVMGLHRLYVIPDGFGAGEGAYLKYPAEDFYAILAIESTRHRAEIVGEDLGTVPSVVRHAMKDHGIRRLYVLQRQLLHAEPLQPSEIGADVLASVNNHDMPPFRAYWELRDIPEKARLGVIAPERVEHEIEKRGKARARLITHLTALGLINADEENVDVILRAATRHLASSDALLVMVTLEDLWLETESQNIPTTSTERPNWRYRFIDDIEELLLQPDVRARLEATRRGAAT